MKIDLHRDLRSYGLAVEGRGAKAPVPDCFDRLFVKAHSQALAHADVVRTSVLSYDHLQRDDSLEFCFPGFL